MRSYIRPVLGNEWRDRENSSGRRIMSRKNVSFDRHEIDVSSYRSNSNYSKTSPRASERSILILRLNYWYLTRISIALLGNRVIKTRRTVIYRSFSKLILFHLTWNKWTTLISLRKKTFVEFDLVSIQFRSLSTSMNNSCYRKWNSTTNYSIFGKYLILKILSRWILSIVLIMVKVF